MGRWLGGVFGLAWLSCALSSIGAQPLAQRTFELHLAQGVVPANERVLRVTQGETVQVRMTSDEAGVIHLHAYRLEARLAPGPAVEWVFKAHASGRYRLEWHGATSSAGSTQGHHAHPLAVLEVRPK